MPRILWALLFVLLPGLPLNAQEPKTTPDNRAHAVYVLEENAVAILNDEDMTVRTRVPFTKPPKTTRWMSYWGCFGSLCPPPYYIRWHGHDPETLALIFRGRLLTIDMDAETAVGEDELGCDARWAGRNRSGQLAVAICEGNLQEHRPNVLLSFDARHGKILQRREVETTSKLFSWVDDQTILFLYPGTPWEKPAKRKPARVEVVDFPSLQVRTTISLPGSMVYYQWWDEGGLLLVTDPGVNDKNPAKMVPGKLYIIDPKAAKLTATVELGPGPGPLAWDAERKAFYFFSIPKKVDAATPATVNLFDGTRITTRFKLEEQPLMIVAAPDHSRMYVLTTGQIHLLNPDLSGEQGTIPLSDPPSGMVFMDPPTLAYVLHSASSAVSAVDLSGKKVVAKLTTGRGSVKFWQDVASVANTRYTAPEANTDALVGPDGKTLYVYNDQTKDVTIIDSATQAILAKVPGSNGQHQCVPGKKYMVLVYPGLTVIDLNKRAVHAKYPSNDMVFLCPCGEHAYLSNLSNKAYKDQGWVDHDLVRIDFATGKTVTAAGVKGLPLLPRPGLDQISSEPGVVLGGAVE
ncbi:MAG: YncE family protein [Acidobacteriia bacterium]|nr:YncE family protein [Terriglobia bacterium]